MTLNEPPNASAPYFSTLYSLQIWISCVTAKTFPQPSYMLDLGSANKIDKIKLTKEKYKAYLNACEGAQKK